MLENLLIKGAREHNLKDITVEIPRNKLVVVTGLSGSGKSSLAFDTIYAEGQRRYVESLSAYARQFLGQMDKPDVDYIEGLSPAISIDQKTTSRNPRSTVGTVTEVYDYLRLLYGRVGEPHCPSCGKLIEQQSVQQIVDRVMSLASGSRFMVMAPLVRGRKGSHQKVIEDMRRAGYVRMYIDGNVCPMDEDISLEKNRKHSLSVVIDRMTVRDGVRQRLTDSVETALKLAEGFAEVIDLESGEIMLFSEHFSCNDCGVSLPEIEPRLFSFNNPYGACPACMGLGVNKEFDLELVVPDRGKKFSERAIAAFSANPNSYFMRHLGAVLLYYGYGYETAWDELPQKLQKILWEGAGEQLFEFKYETLSGEERFYQKPFEGILNILKQKYKEAFTDGMREDLEAYMTATPCPACAGRRLKPEVLSVLVGGKNINEVTAMTVRDLRGFFKSLRLGKREAAIAKQVLKEIGARLDFLDDVGLDYMTLDRSAGTLSGGEAQRIRLATQIGSGLTGVLYILDEPSIGLHQRDNAKLLATLKHLRDLGNTLVVVEHDEETMYAADQIIDMGPGAGGRGGEIVAQGSVEDIKASSASVTGSYLSGRSFVPVPKKRRKCDGRYLSVRGARTNNLKDVDVSFPLGVFTVVTGVSASVKYSLVNDILYRALASKLNGARVKPGPHDAIEGLEHADKVINIDQSPIGRTPRSNPATYTGAFDPIRELFSLTNEAKLRGYKAGRFSFNVKGGRCEACRGDGVNRIEMNFLPDVYVPCEVCHGARYNRDTLEVRYKGKSIADVLDMTVTEACRFFEHMPKIYRKLKVLEDVGLGYIRLGQAATTLSGGEAQRIKLATELSRRSSGRTVYILDEPTTGLHVADVHKLLDVLERLVEAGDSVIVIEHNLDVIKVADYVIDLGPEGGDRGGCVVACGTPEEVAKEPGSYTGEYIKRELAKARRNKWYR